MVLKKDAWRGEFGSGKEGRCVGGEVCVVVRAENNVQSGPHVTETVWVARPCWCGAMLNSDQHRNISATSSEQHSTEQVGTLSALTNHYI